ncbi:MAG: hypothetical protein Kow0037_30340 [Calditrichia bacterium]
MKKWHQHISKTATCLGFIFLFSSGVAAQTTTADTTVKKQKILPELQLEEYTITGLSRIKLPEMDRKFSFKPVKVLWKPNRAILQKQSPAILFNFSRVKPSLLHLYEFPWLNVESYGGSFATYGLKMTTQFKTGKWLPFLSTGFEDSQGHLTNANHTIAQLKGGFHFIPAQGQTISVGTDYRFRKIGLWADSTLKATGEKAQTTLWNSYLVVRQNWNKPLYSNWQFVYFSDEQENVYNQTENGWQAAGEFGLQGKTFGIKSEAKYQSYRLSSKKGRLLPAGTDDIERDLLSGIAELTFQKGLFQARAGYRFQQAKTAKTEQFHYPTAAITVGKPGYFTLEAAYAPQLAMQRAFNATEDLPFFDVVDLPVTRKEQLIAGRLSFNPNSKLLFRLGYTFEKSFDYLAFQAFPDSLNYHGWFSRGVDEAQISDAFARLRWQAARPLTIHLFLGYRKTETRQFRQDKSAVGKQLPFQPEFEVQSAIAWNPGAKWELEGRVKYVGKQYADIANTMQIDPYTDLGLKISYWFSKNFSVFLRGENLLDYDYEKWYGYKAPGIAFMGGLRVKL